MNKVRPKKSLGQHFLNDKSIAIDIVKALKTDPSANVLEIGPGMGVLTEYLFEIPDINLKLIEIDEESVAFLQKKWPFRQDKILQEDFLRMDINSIFNNEEFSIIGNYPYNISNQILFKTYENKEKIPQLVGMFQKEVAERITSKPGKKAYGILSVLLQAFYTTEYLFTVHEHVFNPPPKVKSGVIRLTRKTEMDFACNMELFKTVIKQGFNQRRKVLSNSLKSIINTDALSIKFARRRPEELSYLEFAELTNLIENYQKNQQK
jgi:16S rRNA (adenine1518-N6/adenine1519-N6)-dimethyltransferase